jgi:hypothetical protein
VAAGEEARRVTKEDRERVLAGDYALWLCRTFSLRPEDLEVFRTGSGKTTCRRPDAIEIDEEDDR